MPVTVDYESGGSDWRLDPARNRPDARPPRLIVSPEWRFSFGLNTKKLAGSLSNRILPWWLIDLAWKSVGIAWVEDLPSSCLYGHYRWLYDNWIKVTFRAISNTSYYSTFRISSRILRFLPLYKTQPLESGYFDLVTVFCQKLKSTQFEVINIYFINKIIGLKCFQWLNEVFTALKS